MMVEYVCTSSMAGLPCISFRKSWVLVSASAVIVAQTAGIQTHSAITSPADLYDLLHLLTFDFDMFDMIVPMDHYCECILR